MNSTRKPLMIAAAFLLLASAAFAQNVASFEKRITTRVLDNGLTVIIMERPEAPVFSFFTHVDVGGAQEVPGITGLAHMFEHMAFKGTPAVGSTDYAAEKVALEKVERAYAAYDTERRKPVGRDDKKVEELAAAWKSAIAEADKFVKANEFDQIIESEGAVGVNAFTNSDTTGYFYSLPSNRFELWAYLESERFANPVMREFYKERDVVMEERRMRTESQPIGRLIEQFISTAFIAHPYQFPVVGWMSDLQSFSATDAKRFFDTYYVPANMTITVVGDVKASEAMPVIEKYFGRIPKSPKPQPLRTIEPTQIAERRVTLLDPSQPFHIEGYHRPDSRNADNAVYDVISDVMSNGRTSRLYRSLVRDKKIAAAAAGFNGFPGDKYPNLFVLYAVPTPGHTPEEAEKAIGAEIERLKTEDLPADELKMVKTRAKADLIRQLDDNSGLAMQLGVAQARFGDWRQLFRQVDAIEKVTAADVKRVATATFVPSNRTVSVLESTQMATAKGDSK